MATPSRPSQTPPKVSAPSYLVGGAPPFTPPDADNFSSGSEANDAAVFFYPYVFEHDQSAPFGRLQDTTEVIAHSEIMSLSTSKPKGDVGTFTMILSSDVDWLTLLHPGTWCCIYIKAGQINTQKPDGLKMVGLVKSVRIQEGITEDGKKTNRYIVGGLDFHVLLNSQIYINAGLLSVNSTVNTYLSLGSAVTNLYNANPGRVVETLFDTILGIPLNIENGKLVAAPASKVNSPLLVPPALASRVLGYPAQSNRFTSFMVRYLQTNLLGTNIQIPQANNTVSFWSMAEAYSNRVLNELYTDLMPILNTNGEERLMPSMILRAQPFSSKDRSPHISCIGYMAAGQTAKAYKTTTKGISAALRGDQTYWVSRYVGDQEIMGFDRGKGDAERFNLFFVTANVTLDQNQNSQQLLLKTIQNGNNIHKGSMGRNGVRTFVRSSEYLLGAGASGQIDLANRIAIDIWQDAYIWQNGSVILRGSTGHIPVGSAMVFTDRGIIGHVEGVENNYSVSADGKTKRFRQRIRLSRMMKYSAGGRVLGVKSALNIAGMKGLPQGGEWDRGVSQGTENLP